MKMLENGQIILDFPRQEIYYTHIDQLLLRAGQAKTSVRRFDWNAEPAAQTARIQVFGS